MTRPADIPQDGWDAAVKLADVWQHPMHHDYEIFAQDVASAILAATEAERGKFTDAGMDHDALNSAVGVLRMQQAQPHKSTQAVLWEAIKDYAERAAIRKATP